jgi:DNA-binding transcriptional LysR family regulator
LPTFRCEPEEKSGKLVRLLPEWHWSGGSLQLVYPAQKFVSPKVRAFVEVATEELKGACVRMDTSRAT